MVSDMSGYAGAGGAQRWMQESGGDQAAYDREMRNWQGGQQPAAAPAAPRNTGGVTGRGNWGGASAPTQTPQSGAGGGGTANFNSDFARQFDSSGRPVNLGNVDPSKVLAGTGASGYNASDTTAYRKIDPNIVKNMTPEQRAVWSMQNIDDLSAHGDKERSYAQWMEWQKSYDPDCPPAAPYRAEDGSGCVEKPDNSNKGYQAGGGGGGGGGQGGGGGYGGGGQGGGAWDNPIYKFMANKYMGAAQDPNQAFSLLAGQGGVGQFQQQIDDARRKIELMPPGPARDAALSRLPEVQASTQLGMQQAGQNAALTGLNSLLGGEQYWGGELPLSYNQLGENARQANMQNALGYAGLGTQERLGMANVGLGYSQLGENSRQFGLDFGDRTGAGRQFQAQQNQLDRDAQQKLAKTNQPSTFDRILGAVGGILSDIRVKENIEDAPLSLAALRELPIYAYNYMWEETPRRGVMAQDLEKVVPELVHQLPNGVKTVDGYGLLSLTMGAVKELDKKVARLSKVKEKR